MWCPVLWVVGGALWLIIMPHSVSSLEPRETVLSISESLDYDSDESEQEKKKEEEEEEENTDCRVYITTCILVILCLVIVFAKVGDGSKYYLTRF